MIEKLTQSLLGKCLTELKRKENMCKIETELIDPLIQYAFRRLYPYVWMVGTFLIILFILILITLFILLKSVYTKNILGTSGIQSYII